MRCSAFVAMAALALTAAGHYEYPTDRKCGDDEVYGHVYNTYWSTRVCAPKCDSSGGCPTDVPEGAGAQPKCLLQDENGTKYCTLACSIVPFSKLTCPNAKKGAIKGECEELRKLDFVCMFTAGDRDDGAVTFKHLNETSVEESLMPVKEVVTAEPAKEVATEDPLATCAKPGDCGLAYQACCAGFAAKGIPCGCHLKDGDGKTGADCGTCGSAYSVCCAAFKFKGFPCTCDIDSAGQASVVV